MLTIDVVLVLVEEAMKARQQPLRLADERSYSDLQHPPEGKTIKWYGKARCDQFHHEGQKEAMKATQQHETGS